MEITISKVSMNSRIGSHADSYRESLTDRFDMILDLMFAARVSQTLRGWIPMKFNRSIVRGTLSILVLDTVECVAVSSMSPATCTAVYICLADQRYKRRWSGDYMECIKANAG